MQYPNHMSCIASKELMITFNIARRTKTASVRRHTGWRMKDRGSVAVRGGHDEHADYATQVSHSAFTSRSVSCSSTSLRIMRLLHPPSMSLLTPLCPNFRL